MDAKTETQRSAYKITKSNELIQKAAFQLTSMQYDLLNYIIMRIRPEDTELRPHELSIREYCITVGIDPDSNYGTVRAALKGLADASVWAPMQNEDGTEAERLVRWIEEPILTKGKMIVQLKSYWKPYLTDLHDRYTTMVLQETLPMKSVYGKRLYELLKSHLMSRNGPIHIRYSIEEFKLLIFGKEKYRKLYQDVKHLKRRVLEPAMNDLADYGDLKASYRLIREGHPYKYIDFVIEEKTLEERLNTMDREKAALKNSKTKEK